jgi:large subunit ribosomal protein L7/L12
VATARETKYDVILTAAGERKIQVIKIIRASAGLGLKEAKELGDTAPSLIYSPSTREEAERIVAELVEAGAQAEIR